MPVDQIITNQPVDPEKLAWAREFRSQMTPEEAILWERLRGNRLDGLHFRRQQIILGFIADFYCHSAALVVEVDGGIHDQQVELDKNRDRAFAELGLTVMRVKNEEILQDLDNVLDKILGMCKNGDQT